MVGVELEKAAVLLSCDFGVLGFGLSESHSLSTMEVCESLWSRAARGTGNTTMMARTSFSA